MKNFIKTFLHNLFFMLISAVISATIIGIVVGWPPVLMVWFIWPIYAVICALLFSVGGIKV